MALVLSFQLAPNVRELYVKIAKYLQEIPLFSACTQFWAPFCSAGRRGDGRRQESLLYAELSLVYRKPVVALLWPHDKSLHTA